MVVLNFVNEIVPNQFTPNLLRNFAEKGENLLIPLLLLGQEEGKSYLSNLNNKIENEEEKKDYYF